MELVIYDEAQKIWKKAAQDSNAATVNLELDIHRKLLNIFQVGPFYYCIFNVRDSSFTFVSPEMTQVLGYDAADIDVSFFLSAIHQDDQPWFLNFENAVQDFFRQLPVDKIQKYKSSYDFRIRNKKNEYVRILHQHTVLQHDEQGNVLTTLIVHTDISHLKQTGRPVLSIIGLEGEPSYTNVDVKQVFTPSREILSRREKEILTALIAGKQSKEVGAMLHITKETVDKHRRNMLAKTGTNTTAELAGKAIREGWL
jgi:DNA-binding CsgD family transcriptional regulator